MERSLIKKRVINIKSLRGDNQLSATIKYVRYTSDTRQCQRRILIKIFKKSTNK